MPSSLLLKRRRVLEEGHPSDHGNQVHNSLHTWQGQQLRCRRVWSGTSHVSRTSTRGEPQLHEPVSFLPCAPQELSPPTICRHCCAKKFAHETERFCCGAGKIQLARNEWPAELKRLYTSFEEDALHFQKYARIYNNLFAFSSIGGGINAETKKGCGF